MIYLELDSQNPLRAHIQFSHSTNIQRQFPRWGMTFPINFTWPYITVLLESTNKMARDKMFSCKRSVSPWPWGRKTDRQMLSMWPINTDRQINPQKCSKCEHSNMTHEAFEVWVVGLVWPRTCTWRFSHEALRNYTPQNSICSNATQPCPHCG